MLQVTFYAMEGPTGRVDKVTKGSILLDDNNKIHIYPTTHKDENLMRGLAQDPIWIIDEKGNDVEYDPTQDPVGWIKNLNREYKSYALYATGAKVVESKAAQESVRRKLRQKNRTTKRRTSSR